QGGPATVAFSLTNRPIQSTLFTLVTLRDTTGVKSQKMSDRQRSLKATHELSIRRDYEARRNELEALAGAVRLICESMLRTNGVPFHSIKTRVKSVPSILGKICRKKYEP